MNKFTSDASWVVMALAAILGVAAQQDWTTRKGILIGASLCAAALGAALKTPPTTQASYAEQHNLRPPAPPVEPPPHDPAG